MRNLLALAAVWAAAAVLAAALSSAGVPAAALIAGIVVFYFAERTSLDLSQVRHAAVPARSLIGAAAGSLVTVAALRSLGPVLLWASLVSVAAILAGAGIGLAVAKASGIPKATALVALTPGGLGEMVSVAQEAGLAVEVVTAAHLARRLAMIAVAVAVVALL